jgi:uncharacterized protein (DUF362 family)
MATVLIRDAFDIVEATATSLDRLVPPEVAIKGSRVFLKPNLTYPSHKPGVTTSPRFLAGVVEVFRTHGAEVLVGDGDGGYGAWSADLAFEGHGLPSLCRRYGAKLVNLSTTPSRTIEAEINGVVCRTQLPIVLLEQVDFFVTLPVPKLHSMTVYSGAVKNQWGCIPDTMRIRRHPDFMELVWAVNGALKPKLVLADAQYVLDRTGPIGGDPVYLNLFAASDDILAFDVTFAKRVMGLKAEDIAYLRVGKNIKEHAWEAVVDDSSTGPRHRFVLRPPLRHRVTAAAFPRQWAVNLLWFSPLGHLAHRILYSIVRNPIAEERAAVEAAGTERDHQKSIT